jgi:hypothetical protein
VLYVDSGRQQDALRLLRPAIRQHQQSGATSELRVAVGAALHALVELGHPDVAATMLGALHTVSHSGLERAALAGLDDRLASRLDEAEIVRLRAVGAETDFVVALDALLELVDLIID